MNLNVIYPICAAMVLTVALDAKVNAPATDADGVGVIKKLVAYGVPNLAEAKYIPDSTIIPSYFEGNSLSGVIANHDLYSYIGDAFSHCWYLPSKGGLGGELIPVGRSVRFKLDPVRDAKVIEKLNALPRVPLSISSDSLVARFNMTVINGRRLISHQKLRDDEADGVGSALIYAAQLWQAGEKKASVVFVNEFLNKYGDRDRLIEAGGSIIADAQFEMATDSLMRTGDWSAYLKSLKELRSKAVRNWRNLANLSKIIAQTESRLRLGKSVGPVFIKGIQLDDQTVNALRDLMNLRWDFGNPRYVETVGHTELWLLPVTRDSQNGNGGRSVIHPSSTPIPGTEKLTLNGWASLRTLGALINDETILSYPLSSRFIKADSNESLSQRNTRLYRSMKRPMTCGDLARLCLIKVIPDKKGDLWGMNDKAFSVALNGFVSKYEKSSEDALGLAYLTEGSVDQQKSAFDYFLKSKDEKILAAMEAWLLGERMEVNLDCSRSFIRNHGGRVDFVNKLVSKLNEGYALSFNRPRGNVGYRAYNVDAGGRCYISRENLFSAIKEFSAMLPKQ